MAVILGAALRTSEPLFLRQITGSKGPESARAPQPQTSPQVLMDPQVLTLEGHVPLVS